jgi:CheY-like chemotaxis protein
VSTKHQIAILDDEVEIADYLKTVLEENLVCDVEVFNNPNLALKRFNEKHFDAISLDHRMPNLQGMDLVKLIRATNGPNQHTKILLLTGCIEEAESSHPELLNEVIFIEKPVRSTRYLRWIEFIINNSANK